MATPSKGTTKVKTTTTAPVSTPTTEPAKEVPPVTALVKTEAAPLATRPPIDFASDAENFQDEFDRRSIQIPFLQILQSNSPQIKPGDAKFVEGAKMSMFFQTVSKQYFDGMKEGVEIIPVYHYATIIEWRLREKGGGFIKDHQLVAGDRLLRSTKKDDKGRDVMPNGETHLVATEVYFLILVLPDGHTEQVMCTMTSTQLKKARNWNSRIMQVLVDVPDGNGGQKSVKAPMFFHTYKLKTVSESNAKGSWYGYLIEDGRPTLTIGEDVYLEARAFRQSMQSGVAAGTVNLSGADGGSGDGPVTEEIPF